MSREPTTLRERIQRAKDGVDEMIRLWGKGRVPSLFQMREWSATLAAALSDAAPEGEKAEGEVASFVVRHHDGEVLEHTVTLRADFEEACNYLPEGTVVRLYAEPVPSGVIEKAVQDMAAFARRLAPSTPPADAGCVAALQAWVAEQLSSAESHWIDTLQERWEDGDDVPDREHFVSLWIAERLPAAPAAQAKEA